MKVSILIPVYNVAEYVGRCLDSVFLQTYPDIECVIVDDCGTGAVRPGTSGPLSHHPIASRRFNPGVNTFEPRVNTISHAIHGILRAIAPRAARISTSPTFNAKEAKSRNSSTSTVEQSQMDAPRATSDQMGTTNGIEVSPDGKTLYVNESKKLDRIVLRVD